MDENTQEKVLSPSLPEGTVDLPPPLNDEIQLGSCEANNASTDLLTKEDDDDDVDEVPTFLWCRPKDWEFDLCFVDEGDSREGQNNVYVVPSKEDARFMEKISELARVKHYKHVHLDFFVVYDRIYRVNLMAKLGEIKADLITLTRTKITKEDVHGLYLNKTRFIILEEGTTMWSTGYTDEVERMFNKTSSVRYLECPIQLNDYVYSHVEEGIKRICGPHAKEIRGDMGIFVNKRDFKLLLTYPGFLRVERLD